MYLVPISLITRYRITLHCYQAHYQAARRRQADDPQLAWVKPTELANYPLSTTGRKIVGLIT